ncbi:hypothetical protein LF1_20490 [Rubripirellula obstinata]|uniref:DUF2267 domain-containing protein n=1 Tax=Rubripirellula obstinata TaxID=406547 RepID=A0A5B1CHV8_9BACT|nr:DUF2780 domain-containing protein [Rubripirellula obstinata]KAA1259515.1 hypothetical protein LF1_20490 [Rubripirellula obstinata]
MDELIQQLTAKLGIDESVAQAATGKAMAMVKANVGEDLFSKISSAVPGASDVADAGAEEALPSEGGGGMLGSLAGMASKALGGSAGSGLELGAALGDAGLPTDQMGSFVSTIVEFLKDKVGDEVMDQVLAKFPMLKTLIG